MAAWKSGLKGLATYRPNSVLGAVLTPDGDKPAMASTGAGANQRLSIGKLPSRCSRACAGRAGRSFPKAIPRGPT
jgi:hypothetical protein